LSLLPSFFRIFFVLGVFFVVVVVVVS